MRCGVHETLHLRHALLARLLVPHLHTALLQGITRERQDAEREQSTQHRLTAKERELLALLLSGKGNSEIADTLHRSEKTIKNQLPLLYEKLEVNSRAQAILRAHELRGAPFRADRTEEVFQG